MVAAPPSLTQKYIPNSEDPLCLHFGAICLSLLLDNPIVYRVSQKKYLSEILGSEIHMKNLDCFGQCQKILNHFDALSFFGPFRPFWTVSTILDRLDHSGPFGPFWTVCTILDHFGPFWTVLDPFGPSGPFGIILDTSGPSGPFWTILDC